MEQLIIILIGVLIGALTAFVFVDRTQRNKVLEELLAAKTEAETAAKALQKLHNENIATLQNLTGRLESLELIVKSSTNSPSLVKRF